MRWVVVVLLLISCVTIRENVLDCTDNAEYGIFLEATYFELDTVYYVDDWRYTVLRFNRFYVNDNLVTWKDTLITYCGKEKEL